MNIDTLKSRILYLNGEQRKEIAEMLNLLERQRTVTITNQWKQELLRRKKMDANAINQSESVDQVITELNEIYQK